MRAFRLGLALLVVLALAACGSGGKTISEQQLSSLVLAKADLSKSFSSFYFGRQAQLDNQGTLRANTGRHGRKGGWIARYGRAGSRKTQGPLVVESRADLFGSAAGAKADLADYTAQFQRAPGRKGKLLTPAGIGDGAVGVSFVRPGGLPVRFYSIAWRDRNVTASVTVDGFEGKVSLSDALALAKGQELRISRQK